jgi:hypothetical protein
MMPFSTTRKQRGGILPHHSTSPLVSLKLHPTEFSLLVDQDTWMRISLSRQVTELFGAVGVRMVIVSVGFTNWEGAGVQQSGEELS